MKPAVVGVALGASCGLLLLLVWPLAAIPVAVVAGWLLPRNGRRLVLGGALFGLGVCWLGILNLPDLHPCSTTTISGAMSPRQVCARDLAPLAAVALLAVATGGALMFAGAAEGRARG